MIQAPDCLDSFQRSRKSLIKTVTWSRVVRFGGLDLDDGASIVGGGRCLSNFDKLNWLRLKLELRLLTNFNDLNQKVLNLLSSSPTKRPSKLEQNFTLSYF
jgi:hypothetical protein